MATHRTSSYPILALVLWLCIMVTLGCADLVGIEDLSRDVDNASSGALGSGGGFPNPSTAQGSISTVTGSGGGGGGSASGGGGGDSSCPDENGCTRDGLTVEGDSEHVTLGVTFNPACTRLRAINQQIVAATFHIDAGDNWANHSIAGGTSDGVTILQKDAASPITTTLMGITGTAPRTVVLNDTRCSYPYYCEIHPHERGVVYVDPPMP